MHSITLCSDCCWKGNSYERPIEPTGSNGSKQSLRWFHRQWIEKGTFSHPGWAAAGGNWRLLLWAGAQALGGDSRAVVQPGKGELRAAPQTHLPPQGSQPCWQGQSWTRDGWCLAALLLGKHMERKWELIVKEASAGGNRCVPWLFRHLSVWGVWADFLSKAGREDISVASPHWCSEMYIWMSLCCENYFLKQLLAALKYMDFILNLKNSPKILWYQFWLCM